MTQLISETFGGTLAAWNPASPGNCAISAGTLLFSDEGGLVHGTQCGTGDKWFRFQISSAANADNLLVIGAAANGNFLAVNVAASPTEYALANMTEYTTYTTYVPAGDQGLGYQADIEVYGATKFVGITLDYANKVLRLWANVTAAEPDSITSWDSAAAGATSPTITGTIPGHYVGLGAWTSTPSVCGFDNFTAGNFGAAAGDDPPISTLSAHLKANRSPLLRR